MPLRCRFYKNTYPEKDDVVIARIAAIEKMGSYAELLEYNRTVGMILHSELSRRRIRSINKLVRVGRDTTVMVIRVDQDKQYIDLSKRKVSMEEIVKCDERFSRGKAVNQILTHVAEKLGYETNEQLEALCEKTAWYFDAKLGKKAASFDIFRKAVSNPSVLDECDIDEVTRQALLVDIRHRLMPQPVKIRSDFEVTCFTYEGIDAVKRALNAGLELHTEELPIKINLIAPPLYVLTTQTMERTDGLEKLNKVLETIAASIESQRGTFKIIQAPRLVSDTDEADLKRQMLELEEANREVSGDEDEDGDDDDDEDSDEEEASGDEDVAAKAD